MDAFVCEMRSMVQPLGCRMLQSILRCAAESEEGNQTTTSLLFLQSLSSNSSGNCSINSSSRRGTCVKANLLHSLVLSDALGHSEIARMGAEVHAHVIARVGPSPVHNAIPLPSILCGCCTYCCVLGFSSFHMQLLWRLLPQQQ